MNGGAGPSSDLRDFAGTASGIGLNQSREFVPRSGSSSLLTATGSTAGRLATGATVAGVAGVPLAGDVAGGSIGLTEAQPAASSAPSARPPKTGPDKDRWFIISCRPFRQPANYTQERNHVT